MSDVFAISVLFALGANVQAHTIRMSATGKNLIACFFTEYPLFVFFNASATSIATVDITEKSIVAINTPEAATSPYITSRFTPFAFLLNTPLINDSASVKNKNIGNA